MLVLLLNVMLNPENKDQNWVKQINNGDQHAFHRFVRRFTDLIFYKACQWTSREIFLANPIDIRKRRDPSSGREILWTDETVDAYLWLVNQLKNKLKAYRGKAPLRHFILSIIHSKYLEIDYLRWKDGNPRSLPKLFQDAPEAEKIALRLLRMNKSTEQIATALNCSFTQTQFILNNVIEKLSQMGRLDLIQPISEIAFDESATDLSYTYTEMTIEDLALFEKVVAIFKAALKQLDPAEQHLLKLFYQEGLTTKEIIQLYQRIHLRFPGNLDPNDIQPAQVNRLLKTIRNRLKRHFKTLCQSLEEVQITNKTIIIFLSELRSEMMDTVEA